MTNRLFAFLGISLVFTRSTVELPPVDGWRRFKPGRASIRVVRQ